MGPHPVPITPSTRHAQTRRSAVTDGVANYPSTLEAARVSAASQTGLAHDATAKHSSRRWYVIPMVGGLMSGLGASHVLPSLIPLIVIGVLALASIRLAISIWRAFTAHAVAWTTFWDSWGYHVVAELRKQNFDADEIKYIHELSKYRFKQNLTMVKLATKLVGAFVVIPTAAVSVSLVSLTGANSATRLHLAFNGNIVYLLAAVGSCFVATGLLHRNFWAHEHVDAAIDFYAATTEPEAVPKPATSQPKSLPLLTSVMLLGFHLARLLDRPSDPAR